MWRSRHRKSLFAVALYKQPTECVFTLRRNWKGQMKVTKRLAIYRPKLMCGFIISQSYWVHLSVSIEKGRVKMGYVQLDSINP